MRGKGNQGWDIEKSGTSHSAISSLNSPTAVRMRHCFIIFLHNLLTPLLCSMRHARVYFGRLSSANYDSAGDPFRRTTDTHYLTFLLLSTAPGLSLKFQNEPLAPRQIFHLKRKWGLQEPSNVVNPDPFPWSQSDGRPLIHAQGSPAQNENEQKIRDIFSSAHPNLIEQHQWLLLPNYVTAILSVTKKHQAQKGTTNFSSHPTMPFPPTPSRPPFRSVGLALPTPEINRHLISSRTVHGYRATRILRTDKACASAYRVPGAPSTSVVTANLSRSHLYLVYIKAHDNISARSRSFVRRPWTCHLHRLRVSALISIYAGTLLQLSNNAHPCLENCVIAPNSDAPSPQQCKTDVQAIGIDQPALSRSPNASSEPRAPVLELAIVKTETTLGSFPPSVSVSSHRPRSIAPTQRTPLQNLVGPSQLVCPLSAAPCNPAANSISPTSPRSPSLDHRYSVQIRTAPLSIKSRCPSLGLFAVEGRVGPRHLYGFEQIPRQRLTATNSQSSHHGPYQKPPGRRFARWSSSLEKGSLLFLVEDPPRLSSVESTGLCLSSAIPKKKFDDFSFAKLEVADQTRGTGTDTKPATCCFSVHLSNASSLGSVTVPPLARESVEKDMAQWPSSLLNLFLGRSCPSSVAAVAAARDYKAGQGKSGSAVPWSDPRPDNPSFCPALRATHEAGRARHTLEVKVMEYVTLKLSFTTRGPSPTQSPLSSRRALKVSPQEPAPKGSKGRHQATREIKGPFPKMNECVGNLPSAGEGGDKWKRE
ncbi:uncharacterized protein CLUP02_03837 [Colletotrichum lupini]|uniref:Uncharacterized protein n=1 Tax=Colletotrichum lupini TaxID=145971 RepID=A0A9Q8SJK4_9PEZI|nr:uncharacterized protein CLUP02_03837 [Colletotrichum lupini]UQC78360.1 hypothetical protein CLUP02_03837 [Colletotrichum lupini]